MTDPAARQDEVDALEIAKLDAELQVEGPKVPQEEEPDPRVLFSLLKKTIESYAKLLYGSGVYKVSFTLDPMWTAKVEVEVFGDLVVAFASEDHEAENTHLTPECLGRIELVGDPAGKVGFAVDNLRKTVEALLFSEIYKREEALFSLKMTLADLANSP